MKKIILIFSLFIIGTSDLFAAGEFVNKNTAVVRVMNKAAGKARTVHLPVGSTTEFEKLSITVRTCKQTAPFVPEDNFMFAEISKASAGKIFSGWMSQSEPGDNPLQDADYDLWLVKCE